MLPSMCICVSHHTWISSGNSQAILMNVAKCGSKVPCTDWLYSAHVVNGTDLIDRLALMLIMCHPLEKRTQMLMGKSWKVSRSWIVKQNQHSCLVSHDTHPEKTDELTKFDVAACSSLALPNLPMVCKRTPWKGNAFLITYLWKLYVTSVFRSQRVGSEELWCFLCCSLEEAAELSLELVLIWNATPHM